MKPSTRLSVLLAAALLASMGAHLDRAGQRMVIW